MHHRYRLCLVNNGDAPGVRYESERNGSGDILSLTLKNGSRKRQSRSSVARIG